MSLAEAETITPCITFPNLMGDVTISWDAENEEYVKKMVEEKIKQGYSFFIVKPRKLFGKPIPMMAKTKVKKVEDLEGVNKVTLKTEDDSLALDFVMPKADERTVGVKQKGLAIDVDVKDDELNLGIKNGKLSIGSKPQGQAVSTKRSRDPEEIVKKQSVGVRPIAGG